MVQAQVARFPDHFVKEHGANYTGFILPCQPRWLLDGTVSRPDLKSMEWTIQDSSCLVNPIVKERRYALLIAGTVPAIASS